MAFDYRNASLKEKLDYANHFLGLDLRRALGEDEIDRRIEAALAKTPGSAKLARASKDDLQPGYLTIFVFKSDKDKKNRPVYVGVNGVGYTVPRGVPVDVPAEVVEVLNNAIETQHEWSDETERLEPSDVHSYAFQIQRGNFAEAMAYRNRVLPDPVPAAQQKRAEPVPDPEGDGGDGEEGATAGTEAEQPSAPKGGGKKK